MDSAATTRGDKRRTFLTAIGIVAAVMVLAPPVVQAATQKVNIVKSKVLTVRGNVGVSQLNGATAAGQASGNPGLQEQLPKSLNVNNVAGGEGLWGSGTCAGPTAASRQVTIPAAPVGEPDNVISHVIVGSPDAAEITISAPDLPGATGPIIRYRTTDSHPSQAIDLAAGLRVSPAGIVIECVSGGSLTTDPTDTSDVARFAVLGH